MVDIQYIADNSQGIILILVVLVLIYKTVSPFFIKIFASKEDLEILNKDINHISQKADNYSINAKNEGLALSSTLIEKMRLIQQETIEKSDAKYLSKEMDAQKTKQQEDRMGKFEDRLENMESILFEVKTAVGVNTGQLCNIVDILNKKQENK